MTAPAMQPAALASHLEAWLQEEIAAQRELSKLVERQIEAVRSASTSQIEAIVEELDQRLRSAGPREARRGQLVSRFAASNGTPLDGLTLGRMIERLASDGVDVARLRELRSRLRDEVAALLKRNRRVATLARYHQALFNEILASLAGGDDAPAGQTGGLVNAEV